MAPRTIKATETEIVSALKESTALPISVGNPMAADLLAIDQSHMEEFASAEEKSFDVRIGKPPKGHYFTVRAETVKPWKDRAFYFLLEIEGRDLLHRRPCHRETESGRGCDSARFDCPLCHDGGRGRAVAAQAR